MPTPSPSSPHPQYLSAPHCTVHNTSILNTQPSLSLYPTTRLCPLHLAAELAQTNRHTRALVVVVPPVLALVEVDVERRPALLALGLPRAAEVELGDLEAAAVERDEGCQLPVLGGVGERRGGLGRGGGGGEGAALLALLSAGLDWLAAWR